MKFISAHIKNFMAVGQVTMKLDSRGLVCIKGENLDDSSQNSNGSGKSSIADAIHWCLFGKTARGVTGDNVINAIAKKNCHVEIVLKDADGGSYFIGRYRKDKDHKNSLHLFYKPKDLDEGAMAEDLTGGTDKITQETLNKILGCSETVFKNAVYSGQESMPDFPNMTDKELKTLIEEAAGIDRLQDAHKIALSKVTAAKGDHTKSQLEVDSKKANLETLAGLIKDLKLEAEAWSIKQKEMIEAAKELDGKIAVAHAERGDVSKEMAELEGQVEELSKQIEAVDDEARELEDLNSKLVRLNALSETEQLSYEKNKRDAGVIKDEIKSLKSAIGTPCKECGKPMDESEVAEVIEKRTELLRSSVEELKLEKERLDGRKKQLEELGEIVSDFKKGMTDVSEANAEIRSKEAKIKELADYERATDKLAEKLDLSKASIEKLTKEENPHKKSLKTGADRLRAAKGQLEEAETKILKTEEALEIAEETARIFSPAGIRAHILDTVTPFLNEQTSQYLSLLSDGNISATWSTLSKTAKGDLREKFSIEVESLTGAKSFGGLSGGEKRKVRLSCYLAMQDLVATRASKPIDLLVMDEIDDALDTTGLERLMGVLNEKAKERGTVLLISHNDMNDWITQSVTIRKSEGFSTMVDELGALS